MGSLEQFYDDTMNVSISHDYIPKDNIVFIESKEALDDMNECVHKASYSQNSISKFVSNITDIPGYVGQRQVNMAKILSKMTSRCIESLALGKASVQGDNVMVGTDHPQSLDNYIIWIDVCNFVDNQQNIEKCMTFTSFHEHIRDVKLLTSTVAACATGEGNIQLFTLRDNQSIKHMNQIKQAHSTYIRELSYNEYSPNMVVSGGYDGFLKLWDLSKDDGCLIDVCDISDVVSSTRWNQHKSGSVISVTADNGKLYMFDTRESLKSAFHSVKFQKQDLFTHEWINDNCLLAGYGDGEIRTLDLRMTNQCCTSSTIDPFVEGIGSIEYCRNTNAYVVSGYTDFTVWRHDLESQSASVWSHGKPGTLVSQNNAAYSTSATFWRNNWVVATDSVGSLSLYSQGFY